MLYAGRHGSMSSGELEHVIARNSQFLAVVRTGAGDGRCGLYDSVSGKYIMGVQPGRVPEYSFIQEEAPRMQRGWRNILYELIVKGKLVPNKTVRRRLGDDMVRDAMDYGFQRSPRNTPEPEWNHSQLREAS